FLDGVSGSSACSGDALIRTMAAMALTPGSEVIYAGMYGSADGGATRGGHVMRATFAPGSGSMPVWSDLTFNPVTNDTLGMNAWGLDISGITIDTHDATGNTVYVTVEGFPSPTRQIRTIYRSTDGGAHWAFITSNLPQAPANALVVDPQDANTVYLATDAGVFSTRQVANCATAAASCWSAFGSGLPLSPVVQLSASPAGVTPSVLVAGTYGRGVWEIPLWTAGETLTAASVAPSSLTFASQAYGVASSAQTVTLTNTGAGALMPTAVAVTGDFSETDNCQAATLSAGASCAIQVTFTPTQAGARAGQLTISANIPEGSLAVTLSGTGEAPGAIQLSPPTVGFGEVQVKTTSSALQVTVENNSAVAVPVTSAAVSGPFVLESNACGSSIAANSSCAVALEFAPTQTGNATGTFTLVDGAGTQTVALSGTGAAAPTDTVSPSSLTFAGTIVGQSSAAQTVTLTNSGDEPLTSIATSVSGPFQIAGTCTGQLAGNSTCTISVVFAPTAAGAQSGTLTVADALTTHTVSLAGTGLQAPVISISPASLQFSAQTVGVVSAPLALTVSNTGGAPMANVGFAITGTASGSFSVASTSCGATLANDSSCTAQVAFTPASAGASLATLTVSSSTRSVMPAQVALSGTAASASGINVSPAQMTFSVAAVGGGSAEQTATITNAGATAASGLTLNATAPFGVAHTTCAATLPAESSCVAAVTFTAAASGAVTGSFTVMTTNAGLATVALSGSTGGAGALQVQPSVLTFPATGIGAASSAQTVTLTNTGTVALPSLVLATSNEFEMTATTCSSSLASGASCTVGVAFSPTSAGAQNGTLSVTSSALALTQQVVLAGTGFDFTMAVSGSPSQTVASGQTANYTLVLTPINGSSGTFSFTCGSLPPNSVCSFNPSSTTVNANMTGNVAVGVVTGHTSASLERRTLPWRAVPLLCGLLLLPLGFAKKRRLLLLIAVLGFLVGGVASCSGAGGGSGGSGGGGSESNTPAGNYTIPVTATANGISHQTSISLTVD
ncbi:MAG: choice-of-anchor D domain-containing protein, partial [Terracidiphilus sp.]